MNIHDEIKVIIDKFEVISKLQNENKEIALSKRQEAVLMGVVLGDGYIQKISESSYRFKTNHSKHQKSQIDTIAKIFSNFKPGISVTKKPGKTGQSVVYTLSFSNPVLKKYHSMFYTPTKKVTNEILNKFTDESWAYYFFDNGSYHDKGGSDYYRLHTEALGPGGAKMVQSRLSSKGFKSTMYKRGDNGKFILNFATESTPKISALLKRYASSDLQYKIKSEKSKMGAMVTQSIILSKEKFKTKALALSWMKVSDFKKHVADETSTSFRFRQMEPSLFKEGSFRTKQISDGVSLVLAQLKDDKSSKQSEDNTSKFSSVVVIKDISKMGAFLPNQVMSDLDIKIPMNVELWILSTGTNRDGEVTDEELQKSKDTWEGIDIIRHHDMKARGITEYGIHEEFGVTDSAKIVDKDGKRWLVADARITNRPVAYNMYLRELRDEPIEISAEYFWTKGIDNYGKTIQKDIRGGVISLVDRGHIKGNKIIPKK